MGIFGRSVVRPFGRREECAGEKEGGGWITSSFPFSFLRLVSSRPPGDRGRSGDSCRATLLERRRRRRRRETRGDTGTERAAHAVSRTSGGGAGAQPQVKRRRRAFRIRQRSPVVRRRPGFAGSVWEVGRTVGQRGTGMGSGDVCQPGGSVVRYKGSVSPSSWASSSRFVSFRFPGRQGGGGGVSQSPLHGPMVWCRRRRRRRRCPTLSSNLSSLASRKKKEKKRLRRGLGNQSTDMPCRHSPGRRLLLSHGAKLDEATDEGVPSTVVSPRRR